MATILSFEPVILSDQEVQKEQSSNQGWFSPIKILDLIHKRFYWQHVSDYPIHFSLTVPEG